MMVPSRWTAVLHLLFLLYANTRGDSCEVDECIGVVRNEYIQLTESQKQGIIQDAARISDLKSTCVGSIVQCENTTEGSIVDLTTEQKNLILIRYGTFFGGTVRPEVLDDDDDVSDGSDTRRRRVANVGTSRYVCPPAVNYKDIRFALNGIDQILQMVQMDNETYQWVLTETCSSSIGDMEDVVCFERERFIPAVVVNLETQLIDIENVQVACCTAMVDTTIP